MGRPTDILCVLDSPPVPAKSGGVIRVNHLVHSLVPLGHLSILVLADLPESRLRPIAEAFGGAHVTGASVAQRQSLGAAAKTFARRPDVPFRLGRRDFRAVRSAFANLTDPDFAATFFSSPLAWESLRDVAPTPHVVNLNDLPSRLHRRMLRRRVERVLHPMKNDVSSAAAWTADTKRLLIDAADYWRWPRFEADVARTAELVVVPSREEVIALDSPAVAFVPNGATEPPEEHADPSLLDRTPRDPCLVFPASFNYEPNQDGARFLVEKVLPALRRLVPDVRMVLAGAGSEALQSLARTPGVETTGFLPDFEVAWRQADVVVVPLRVGGGTRLKIIEAWARGLPVVSTRIGAEGLDAVDGQHLVLADSPDDFAAACASLLVDQPRGKRLGDEGRRLFAQRYRWDMIEAQFRALVERVLPR